MAPYIYITTPIFYVNDRPHLGHAYTIVAADILARFYRMDGRTVRFTTGTDEHGGKIATSALKAGISAQQYVDQFSVCFQEMATSLQSSHDDFLRTTEQRHKESAVALWKKLEENGHIYLGSYSGWYAVRDEAFYQEKELINGKAPTGAEVEWIEEPCYFFRLSSFQSALCAFYQENPEAVGPKARLNEVLRFIEGGLCDLAVSRSRLSWGIPVPGAPGHVMYVWIDALANYLSSLGYPHKSAAFSLFWENSLHLVGKDILRFHSVYWPAFLIAADLLPPRRVFAHGWWTVDGEKMSKSVGNVIDPRDVIARYGISALRYFLFREIVFGEDGNFSDKAMTKRLNDELANDLGNLAQRLLSFIQQKCAGAFPQAAFKDRSFEKERHWGNNTLILLRQHLQVQNIYAYLDVVMQGVRQANAAFTELAPWKLAKGCAPDQEKMYRGLAAISVFLRDIALFLHPIMQEAMTALLLQMGIEGAPSLQMIGQPLKNTPLAAPAILFHKREENP